MRLFLLLYHLIFLLSCLARGAKIQFINPPPFGTEGDFSLNPIYPLDSTVNIQWEQPPDGIRTSVTLFQLNGTQYLLPFEYIIQNTKSETVSTEWTVRTTKDLKVSNLFFLSIFLEGETGAQSNSHYFNISVPKSDADATTTTSVSKSASATISIDSTSTSTPTSASQSSPSPPSSPSIELGTGAKVGIGIGAAAALALGVMIGWLLFGRKKKQTGQVSTGLGLSGRYYDVGKSLHTDYPFKAELPAAAMMHELPATPLPHRQPQ